MDRKSKIEEIISEIEEDLQKERFKKDVLETHKQVDDLKDQEKFLEIWNIGNHT